MRPRAASSSYSCATRGSSQLPAIVKPSSRNRHRAAPRRADPPSPARTTARRGVGGRRGDRRAATALESLIIGAVSTWNMPAPGAACGAARWRHVFDRSAGGPMIRMRPTVVSAGASRWMFASDSLAPARRDRLRRPAPAAGQSQAPGPPASPPPPPSPTILRTSATRRRGRLGVEDRTAAHRRAGDDDRSSGPEAGGRAVDQLRRPAAQRARREHHADLRARRQRHQPRRHQLAGDVAAHRRRRPQRLSGFLRLHDVGLRARTTSTRSSGSKSSAVRRRPSGAPTR